MPDFFEGNPAKIEWYPPTDDQKKAVLGKWFEGAVVCFTLPAPYFLHVARENH